MNAIYSSISSLDPILTVLSHADISTIEGRIPTEFGSSATEVPGSRSLLTTLDLNGAKWGIVTSGTRELITCWIERFMLPHPEVFVAAEDVEIGKPDPQGYLLGRRRLGLEESTSILVLEDAPAGIKAGKAAGFKVLAVQTSHSLEKLRDAGPDWIVEDLRSVTVKVVSNRRVQIEIKNAFK